MHRLGNTFKGSCPGSFQINEPPRGMAVLCVCHLFQKIAQDVMLTPAPLQTTHPNQPTTNKYSHGHAFS